MHQNSEERTVPKCNTHLLQYEESSLSARRMYIKSLPTTRFSEPLADADVGIAEALQPHRTKERGHPHIPDHACNQAMLHVGELQ